MSARIISDSQIIEYLLQMVNKHRKRPFTIEKVMEFIMNPLQMTCLKE